MIDSWTSEGMDWANPDPLQAKYWEAIRLAINECLYIVDHYVFIDRPVWDNEEAFNLSCNVNYVDTLNSWLDYLIPKFLNFPTESDWFTKKDQGNWGGDNLINWNQSTILSYINSGTPDNLLKSELIDAGKSVLLRMYNTLNALKWIKHETDYYEEEGKYGQSSGEASANSAWNVALADFNSKSFQPVTQYFSTQAQITYYSINQTYAGYIWNARVILIKRGWNTGGLQASFYPVQLAYTTYNSPEFSSPDGYEFHNIYSIIPESAEILIQSGTEIRTPKLTQSNQPQPPADGVPRWCFLREDGEAFFVFKFDGPNGKKFQA